MSTLERFRHLRAGDVYLGEKDCGGECYIPRKSFETHAHLLGPTGTGKTRLLQLIAQQFIDAGDCAVVVIDPHDGKQPHGGLYHALKSHCLRHDHASRLITIDPEDCSTHQMVAGFNPLSRGRSPIVRAGLGVEHLRAVVGQGDQSFASAPMLARWCFNTFLGLIETDLAMVDASRVLNLDDATYREGFGELLREKYPDVASDWRWLVEQDNRGRARDLIDAKLGSTTNRIRGYTTNEVLRHMLGTRERVIDVNAVMRDRLVVLANLNPRGLLLREDQRMLGIQLMHSFCRAAMDRTDLDPPPCFLIVDEFSEFVTPEVLEILDGRRKFGLHLILAHQFMSQLQNVAAQDWRYYHSVLTNARLRIVFGGLGETDATTIAGHMYGAHLDPFKVKQEIYHTVQTSHQEWVTLISRVSSAGGGTAHSSSSSQGHQGSTSSIRGETSTSDPFSGLATVARTFADGYGAALSAATSEGTSESANWSESTAVSRVPITVPDDPRQELGTREFMSLEEQLYSHASKMRLQPNQHAILQVQNDYPVAFRVADVPDPRYTMNEIIGPDSDRLRVAPWAIAVPAAIEEAAERDKAFRSRLSLPPPDAEPSLSKDEARRRLRASRAKRIGK